MAANRNGRVIFLDAAGTYNALYDAKEFVTISLIILTSTGAAAGQLQLYANIVATDATKQIVNVVTAANSSDNWSFAASTVAPPDSFAGLTAVLTGANSLAFIYVE